MKNYCDTSRQTGLNQPSFAHGPHMPYHKVYDHQIDYPNFVNDPNFKQRRNESAMEAHQRQ